ncbi:MAG: hypothetical protein Q4A76_09010 [Porphyromonadaceae bacterium]|nr:hypothetical protein [Porphyromonadaceae bacterium]
MKSYALYNENDEILTVGTVDDIARYLGKTARNVRGIISKLKCGVTSKMRKGYMIYEVSE